MISLNEDKIASKHQTKESKMEGGEANCSNISIQLQPPIAVSLSPFSTSMTPCSRRLSSMFTPPSQPVKARRNLAWVSLQGRLIGAEDASSVKTIGGGLTPQEVIAWELFSPIHRILIVAVVAAAAADSKKNRQILQLKKSVELRDQVLLSMQQKLDDLCEQLNHIKDQPEPGSELYFHEQQKLLANDFALNNRSSTKLFSSDEVLNSVAPLGNEAQPEERRLSDLSDWAPSVASSADIQLNSLPVEQDIYNLRRECEDKDKTIRELANFIRSSEVLGLKRISELEDLIRRKNMTITKLKRDTLILEQKVVNLTRQRRQSFLASSSTQRQLPVMADNLLYDMDSTTSASSSDSDSSHQCQSQAAAAKTKEIHVQNCVTAVRDDDYKKGEVRISGITWKAEVKAGARTVSPLKEKSLNQAYSCALTPTLRLKQPQSSSGEGRSRRRLQTRPKDVPHRRWM